MNSADYTKAVLATFCWQEDKNDNITGLIAAGLIIGNRVRAGWNGSDWLLTIQTAPIFSYLALPLQPKQPVYGDFRDPMFQKVLHKVETIFSGAELDFTRGSLYYARLNEITSDWFRQEILGHLDLHPRVADAGRLTFFR